LLSSSRPNLSHTCSTKSSFSCWCICLSRILVRNLIILAIFVGIYVEYVRSTCELPLSSPYWNSETSNWVYPSHSSSTIILWSMIHARIIFPILTLSQKSAGFLTMAKRACKTPKARSTSFRTASWRWANKTAFGPCGIGIDWIKVAHFG